MTTCAGRELPNSHCVKRIVKNMTLKVVSVIISAQCWHKVSSIVWSQTHTMITTFNVPFFPPSKLDLQLNRLFDLLSNNVTGRCYEAEAVGTVSDEQIETRSSRRRTYEARADCESRPMTSNLKSQPSRVRLVTAHISIKDRAQENSNQVKHVLPEVQETSCISSQDIVAESEKSSVGVRGHRAPKKVPTTPVRSTSADFDLVTPTKEYIRGSELRSPRPSVSGPAALQIGDKGKVYYVELHLKHCSLHNCWRHITKVIMYVFVVTLREIWIQ